MKVGCCSPCIGPQFGYITKGLKGKVYLIMILDFALQSHCCLFHVLWLLEGSILVMCVDLADLWFRIVSMRLSYIFFHPIHLPLGLERPKKKTLNL